MLPTNRRVKKEFFSEIIKNGSFLPGNNFYLKFVNRNGSTSSPQVTTFSFVVPAKIVKTSVGRHLIKRKMTAAVEKVLVNLKTGYSVIVFNKKDVTTLTYKDIEREILDLLSKIKVLN
jgi:ribonuclease P protein component